MITIIDYGLGNIKAFANLYKRLNIKTIIATTKNDLSQATRIILPGVGSFDYAMFKLNGSGMRDALEKKVLVEKVPVIGICVGMQMLARTSEEGKLAGLGWIDANVRMFNPELIPFKTRLPHMGWNSITINKECGLLDGLSNDSRFYFLHSYYFECNDIEDVITTTNYGISYASAVNKENIFGIQFHPEKSHSNGIKLLYNYTKI
jgi:glutamine amidotransferase